MKAVVLSGRKVLLLENGRGEWELPGGRLEPGETPEECVAREVLEETGISVEAGPPVRTWVYEVVRGKQVFIVAYGCSAEGFGGMEHSPEHVGLRFFSTTEIGEIPLDEGYVLAVRAWEKLYSRKK